MATVCPEQLVFLHKIANINVETITVVVVVETNVRVLPHLT